MRRTLVVAATLCLLVSSGCSSCNAPPTPSEPDAAPKVDTAPAKAVVEKFYAAMAAHDCESLKSCVNPVITDEQCKSNIEEFEEHNVKFLCVAGAVQDARDPRFVIVTVRVRMPPKEEKEQLMRTSLQNGVWKIEFRP